MKKFATDTFLRVMYTMAETGIAMLLPYSTIAEIDAKVVVSTVILSGIVTLLKSVAVDLRKYNIDEIY